MPTRFFRPFVLLSCLSLFATGRASSEPAFDAAAVMTQVERVADWQLAHPIPEAQVRKFPPGFGPRSWRAGVLYTALGVLAEESGEARFAEALQVWGRANGWKPGPRGHHADDQAVLHAYLSAHELSGDPAPLAAAVAAADLAIERVESGVEPWLWHWSDALFMAAPAYAALSRITGDPRYADFLDEQYEKTFEALYDPEERLIYRDEKFVPMRDDEGGKIFWGRGNGWAFAATALVLDELPADHPRRAMYEEKLVEMAGRLVELQQRDGFWRASLLNPDAYVGGESSATGFFAYGLAWSINRGLLDAGTHRPAVEAAWAALTTAVSDEGRLGFVQPGGDRPHPATRNHHEYYGTAAFILAGLEVAELVGPGPPTPAFAAPPGEVTRTRVGEARARTGVNATPFRSHPILTSGGVQVTGFYGPDAAVMLASRPQASGDGPGTPWSLKRTRFRGKAGDAHNGISLAVDGAGFLHVAWDHHANPLNYVRGRNPRGLDLGDRESMIGRDERHVTYPQFLNLPDGRLLFLYRSGGSGNGNLVVNRYDPATRAWTRLHDVLVDGEGERNAYWQAAVDAGGRVHLSWVWRETGDVRTNHDLAYAVSDDAAETWERSDGATYQPPINRESAEYAGRIPQDSGLINQTSMAIDDAGRPHIVTYWRGEEEVPQLRLVRHDGERWRVSRVAERTLGFELGGHGTRRPPLSRPQLAIRSLGPDRPAEAIVIFRDAERDRRVSVAVSRDAERERWAVYDLTAEGFGRWEPVYDRLLWADRGRLDLFLQDVAEDGKAEAATAEVLSWTPPER